MDVIPKTLVLPPRTLTGPGTVTQLPGECAGFGPRGLLVHGESLAANGTLERIMAAVPDGVDLARAQHSGGEPTLEQLETLLDTAREHRTDWVAAVGGGSVLDLAKACAGLLDAPLPPVAYHDGADIPPTRVPFVAVPATAGTGSESTIVAVLTNSERGTKKSIRHPSFMARLVILDPGLLASCPPTVIASSGMDAFTQAIESFVSRGASWFSDVLALKAAGLIHGSLEDVLRGATGDPAARLMLGSYLAGTALSNARLGLVHGLAHPLGVRYHQPHGLVCAVCLPPVLEFNRKVMDEKYAALSRALDCDLLSETRRLLTALGIESPFAGKDIIDQAGIVSETLASGSTGANPRPVEPGDVEQLLQEIFESGNTPLLPGSDMP